MTRKESIEVLKDLWRYEHSEFSEKDIRKALDIAINSLDIDERYGLEYEQAEQKSPCDVCRYNPPGSEDCKPCTICPACGRK